MGLKTSGETMQSLNNASRRCAHISAIFSPPGCALPKGGAGREAIVFTTRYVMQRGAKEGQTVGIEKIMIRRPSRNASAYHTSVYGLTRYARLQSTYAEKRAAHKREHKRTY